MTIICALCDSTSHEVWLGCNDGITIGDMWLRGSRHSKWQFFGPWAIGLAGTGLSSDMLKNAGDEFPVDENQPSAVTAFVEAVFAENEIGVRDDDDNTIRYPFAGLLAHRDGRVWDVDPYLALAELQPGGLWARGSGMEYALGADYPLASQGVAAEMRVRNAVEAAICYDTGCPGDAIIEKLA